MRLLRFVAIFVTLLGVAALAFGAAPGIYRSFDSHALAQGTRARELTVLAGRGAGIGVRVSDDTESGVVVEDVQADSPAEKAGLKRSDVIVEFDGERVRSARQFARLVQETPSGRSVKAVIRREGQRKDVEITPGEPRGDMMVSGELGDYMRDLGRDLGRLGERLPFNFTFDIPGTMTGRRLGVTVEELTHQLADYFGAKDGVLVTAVTDGSAAARAGLKAGDVITSINGERVASREDLLRLLRDTPNEDVTIGIVRDKKDTTVKAKLEQLPSGRPSRGRPA